MSLLLLVFLGFQKELLIQDKYFFLMPFFYKDLSVRKWKKMKKRKFGSPTFAIRIPFI